jgi:hypothetical protein
VAPKPKEKPRGPWTAEEIARNERADQASCLTRLTHCRCCEPCTNAASSTLSPPASPSTHTGNFCVLTDLGRLDVMQWLNGVDTDDLNGHLNPGIVEGSVDGIPVRVCSLEHLRAMKRAARRPQDLEDLRRLREV